MKDIKKAVQLLKADGIKGLYYGALMKLREKEKEQVKYNKWIQRFEYQMPCEKADNNSAFSITLICVNENMWEAIDTADGKYLAFYYEGDFLSEDWQPIVTAYLMRHKETRFLYTDEDFFSDWVRKKPIFKPEWSPDTYMSYDYIGGLLVLEKSLTCAAYKVLLAENNENDAYGNGRLYALGLCAAGMLRPEEIGHLKRVLYHRKHINVVDKEYLIKIKKDFIRRKHLNAYEEFEPKTGRVRIVFNVNEGTKASLIIPSKNQADVLKTCIETADNYSGYDNYEWIIVDNGSSDEERRKYEALAGITKKPYKYIYDCRDFNFAAMCNKGAEESTGDCLVFLNDDIEFFHKSTGWLNRMVGQAMQPHTGTVGAKLLYPDTSIIQHIGVVNYQRGAAHIFNGADDNNILAMNRNCMDVNVSVATGALLAVERKKFYEIGGFCEELKVTYNDVELCFSLLEKGYYNVVRSDIVAYHHESLARGEDALDMEKYRRCLKEREKLYELHPKYIGVDAYYHPYLTSTDLNGGITTSYPPLISKVKKLRTVPQKVNESVIKYRIDSVEEDQWTRVKGYAFRDNPGNEKTSLVLLGEESFIVPTSSIFNHTYTHVFNDGKSYAFICFDTIFEHEKLPAGSYEICIKIGNKMIKTKESIFVEAH